MFVSASACSAAGEHYIKASAQLSTTVSPAWVLPETLAQIYLGPLLPYGDFAIHHCRKTLLGLNFLFLVCSSTVT